MGPEGSAGVSAGSRGRCSGSPGVGTRGCVPGPPGHCEGTGEQCEQRPGPGREGQGHWHSACVTLTPPYPPDTPFPPLQAAWRRPHTRVCTVPNACPFTRAHWAVCTHVHDTVYRAGVHMVDSSHTHVLCDAHTHHTHLCTQACTLRVHRCTPVRTHIHVHTHRHGPRMKSPLTDAQGFLQPRGDSVAAPGYR